MYWARGMLLLVGRPSISWAASVDGRGLFLSFPDVKLRVVRRQALLAAVDQVL